MKKNDIQLKFHKKMWPSWLGLWNTPTASLQKSKTPPNNNAGPLENVEYPFIAIAPRSTLAKSGSTW